MARAQATTRCACGCGDTIPDGTRFKKGHIRRLEGAVGRAIVAGERLTIYGRSVDPVELVRSGEVKPTQLPAKARAIIETTPVRTGSTSATRMPSNDSVKDGGSAKGTEIVFGPALASLVKRAETAEKVADIYDEDGLYDDAKAERRAAQLVREWVLNANSEGGE